MVRKTAIFLTDTKSQARGAKVEKALQVQGTEDGVNLFIGEALQSWHVFATETAADVGLRNIIQKDQSTFFVQTLTL